MKVWHRGNAWRVISLAPHTSSLAFIATMQGRQLISIDNVQVYHLLGGESHLLATGQLSVALVRAPLDASRPASPASFHTAASSPVDEKRKDGTASPRGLDVLILSLILPGDSEPLWEMATPPHSRIVSTPPSSYTIPNTTAGPASEDSGFIRVTLPAGLSAETRETFESILWCEASFSTTLEEAMTTQMTAPPPDYADPSLRSRLVLLNDSGDVVGTLSGNEHVVEDPSLSAEGQGSNEKEPVIIEQTVSSTGEADFTATPLSKLKWEPTPNPSGSGIITAADYLSRGIIVGAGYISRNMEAGASKWVTTRPSTTKPMEFTPTTKARLATANKYTGKAVVVTGKTAAVIADAAGRFGTKIGQSTGMNSNSDGKPPAGWRGVLNKSLIALNTVSDAVEAG